MSAQQAFINIFAYKIEFINPNNPTVFGRLDPKHFTPVAKNPTVEFVDGELFSTIIQYREDAIETSGKTSEKSSGKDSGKTVGKTVEKSSGKIKKLIKFSNKITIAELAAKTGISTRAVEKQISKLKERGIIKRIGPDKGGYWQIVLPEIE